ncbi:GNAT family N-acetyltransferase [Euzebya tangerina]|uniref:GNAT family N-acetyltransferase n=1 Tax=Euzebya tangerina TaxID=591198 RepID=UPI000E311119|nr:GNAT family N-acetyltransferase [Euzebya tangerina]
MKRRTPKDVTELTAKGDQRIWVRPIREDDRAQLLDGWSRLSERSRYMRFHSPVKTLSEATLDYLLNIDHHDHEALVALDPDAPDEPGVGVARYIRLEEDPTIAEAAITVIDEYQGRGIGTALIGMLEQLAHARGIRTFRNYVLAENRTMLEIFRQLDGEIQPEGSTVFRVDVPVRGPEEAQPDTPAGRWVASVGRQTESEADEWAYPLLWLYRKVADIGEVVADASPSRLLKGWAEDQLRQRGSDEEE